MLENNINEHITEWFKGNDAAFRCIFDHYFDRLYNTCYKTIKIHEDSEEIVMNVFLNIWRYRSKVIHIEDFDKYLFRSLYNQIADFHRKHILKTQDIDVLPLERLGSTKQPELLDFKDLQQIYLRALDKLPEKKREIFLMSREQGLSQKQIADIKKISVIRSITILLLL